MTISRCLLSVVLASAVTLGAGLAPDRTPRPVRAPAADRAPSSRPAGTTFNWAGYVQRAPGTHAVGGQWHVPDVTGPTRGATATWVGIDGFDSHHLVQVGTATSILRGRPRTYAWWEILAPGVVPPMQLVDLDVRPGDHMSAAVTVRGGTARLSLRNLTTGRSVTTTRPYHGPGRSAAWVQECVDVDHRYSPAVGWSSVTFTHATRNDAPARLRAGEAVDVVDGHGVRETRTSTPSAGQDGFTIHRVATGHWTEAR